MPKATGPARTRPGPIRVAIVEDDAVFRNTLVRYLQLNDDLQCVAAYKDARTCLQNIAGAEPQVVLMDINLPDMSGIACARELCQSFPGIKVLMLTVFNDDEQVFEAITAGAFGYLLKSSDPASIIEGIREVDLGGAPMSAPIARKVVQLLQNQRPKPNETDSLSERELEVLRGLSKGHTYKRIALELGISSATVRTYVQRIYEKLHVHSIAEAVMKLRRD